MIWSLAFDLEICLCVSDAHASLSEKHVIILEICTSIWFTCFLPRDSCFPPETNLIIPHSHAFVLKAWWIDGRSGEWAGGCTGRVRQAGWARWAHERAGEAARLQYQLFSGALGFGAWARFYIQHHVFFSFPLVVHSILRFMLQGILIFALYEFKLHCSSDDSE